MGTNVSPVPQADAGLSGELADFMIELSIAMHKVAMYPGGHPILDAAEARVMARLEVLVRERSSLAFGVAREQLVIEGVATDAKNPLIRSLARHLHRHGLGAVKFLAGVRRDELAEVLRAIASDPERTGVTLGDPRGASSWPHVRLFSMSYNQLELVDEDAASTEPGIEQSYLWLELAQAALQSELADEATPTDPGIVADAINTHVREQAYDQVIVGYLLKIANELVVADQVTSALLQRRISQLIKALEPEQLRNLLDMSGNVAQRQRFVIDAAQSMAVDAVLVLVQTASESSNKAISAPLMRLFTKLAEHAEDGTTAVSYNADAALREQVRELVGNWTLADPNPGQYSAVLERIVESTGLTAGADDTTHDCEPERMVQMGLEIGATDVGVLRAVDAMVDGDQLPELLRLLDTAPAESKVAVALWSHVATPRRVRKLLEGKQPALECLAPLVQRIGIEAAIPLLDALATSQSRALRRKVLDLLLLLGPPVASLAAARLVGSPWYVQRNLLILLDRLASWPADFSPLPYAAHADVRVRREAIRLLLKYPAGYSRGICTALTDTDAQVLRIALGAALEKCPPDAVRPILVLLANRQLDPELELLAIRVLAGCRSTVALHYLVRRAMARRSWIFRRRLAAKSPQLLVLLASLGAHWPSDPTAVWVLTHARANDDPDIRAAVSAWAGAA